MLSQKKNFMTRMTTHIWMVLMLKWMTTNKVMDYEQGDGGPVMDDDYIGGNDGGRVGGENNGDFLDEMLWKL